MSQRKILPITPHLLLRAYSIGLFPMAESAEDDDLFWVDPDPRAIFPLESFKPGRSLAKVMKANRFEIRIDTDFQAVLSACAAPAQGREKHGLIKTSIVFIANFMQWAMPIVSNVGVMARLLAVSMAFD